MSKEFTCDNCNRKFTTRNTGPSRANKYCSQECYRAGRRGQHTKRYSGGHISAYGYRILTVDGKKIPEHRFVMEQHLGRPLKSTEVVHHIDHNRLNNAIENLQLIKSNSEHRKIHFERYRNDTHKQCNHCLEIKPRQQFYKINKLRTTDPHHSTCKKCLSLYYKAKYQKRRNRP